MTTADLIASLTKAGCVGVSEWRVNRAIRCGHIKKPSMNSSLAFQWAAADFADALSWFKANPVRTYRRRSATAGV